MSDDGGTLIGGSSDAQVHGHRSVAIFDVSNATFVLTTFSASRTSPRVQR